MQLAASSLHLHQEAPCDGTPELLPFSCHLRVASVKIGPSSPTVIYPTLQTGRFWAVLGTLPFCALYKLL